MKKNFCVLLSMLATALACRRTPPAHEIAMTPSHAEDGATASPAAATAEGGSVLVAGISFTAPPSWRREPPSSSMRAAQFAIPGGGNEKDGSVAVYYFGSGQGGGVDENVSRWQGQFSDPSGTPPVPAVTRSESHGLKVTIVTVKGTYASGMPMGPSTPEPGFALWGAIIENPQGSVFVKATGPSALIAREQPRFEALLASLRPSTSV